MTKKTNKKDKKKENEKNPVKSFFSFGKALFYLSALLSGLCSYYAYNVFTTVPETPKLDEKFWWGTYPMDSKQDLSIRPFEIVFSDVVVNDLKERLLHRRPFAPPLEEAGFTYGFNTNYLTRVLDYWQNNYNFKEREQFFNKFDQFLVNIQGLDIHYMHVKPKVTDDVTVVPILMLHGWPGSVREFYEIIPKLTAPRPAHQFVFEVIAPSLPGYGFSQAASRPGLGAAQIAVIMRNLMLRLGYNKFYMQGGDWGHVVSDALATLYPDNVLGFHSNTPTMPFNPVGGLVTFLGSLWPNLVVEPGLESRMYPLSKYVGFLVEESGYFHLQATKPDTVGIALTDSPAGLAAYILEKFSTWTNPDNRKAGDGNLLQKYSLTHLLDNIMVYWVSNSITTSMRLYAETLSRKNTDLKIEQIPTAVPTWGIKFKHDVMYTPDFVLKLKYKNYLHSTIVDDGGHFAAFEHPDIMANDIFEAVDTFRQFHASGGKAPQAPLADHETANTIYDFTVNDINGKQVKLNKYKGHVTIIVNVASQCGLTDTNYKQLNELYEKYSQTRGLRILAFPCNQFNGQEPGSPKEILTFTKEKQVMFDLFEKIEVNGDNAHPLWKFLKRRQGGTVGDFIKWNFSKFIVDKNGVPVERLGPNVNPLDLEPYLAKYW